MTYSLFPEESATWKMHVTLPTDTTYDESAEDAADPTPLVNYGDRIVASVPAMPTGQTVEIYAYVADGFCITDEHDLLMNLKCSKIPTFFGTAEIFIEDADGNDVTFPIAKDDFGYDFRIDLSAHPVNASFNPAFVTKVGFRFLNPTTADTTMTVVVSALIINNDRLPTYTDAQSVVRFMGMLTNEGKPFTVTHASYPTLETINDIILQAEAFIDGKTKNSWRENRVVGELYNAPFDSSVLSSVAASSRLGMLVGWNTLLKGFPLPLYHQHIRAIDYQKGDRVECRMFGTNWVTVPFNTDTDSTTPANESSQNVWCDEEKGIIFIKQIFVDSNDSVRVTYRWGEKDVPDDIKLAANILAAKQILSTDWFRAKFPLSPSFDPDKSQTIKNWNVQLAECLHNHINLVNIGGI